MREGVGELESDGVLELEGLAVTLGVCDGVAVKVPVLVVEIVGLSDTDGVGVSVGEVEGVGEALAQMSGVDAPVLVLPPAAP